MCIEVQNVQIYCCIQKPLAMIFPGKQLANIRPNLALNFLRFSHLEETEREREKDKEREREREGARDRGREIFALKEENSIIRKIKRYRIRVGIFVQFLSTENSVENRTTLKTSLSALN